MSNDNATLNIKKISDLIKQYKERPPSVKVGIIGKEKNSRDDGKTNAEIGAIHEFDTINKRSFLRMPIFLKLNEKIESNLKTDDNPSLHEIAYRVGILAEATIDEAFETGGWGNWTPSQKMFMQDAETQDLRTLVETGQLRASISSEVEK